MDKKQLFDLRADVAVMIILREFGLKPKGALDHLEMERTWPEYGLRDSDLPAALGRLERRGHVRSLHVRDGDWVMLTEAGALWANALPGWLEYKLVVPRRSVYQSLRLPGPQPRKQVWDRRSRSFPRAAAA